MTTNAIPQFQTTATCPACKSPQIITAVPVRGSGILNYECNRCGQQTNPQDFERATATISNKELTLPKMLGEIQAK